MKKILIAGIMLMSAPFVSFAQTEATTSVQATGTITVTNPGLLPGDFFYFLDRWTELLNTALTFNKEKKAKLHFEYAKERVAEIKDVLKKPDAKLEDVASAKENLNEQVAEAAAIVKEEKDKGNDVSKLARELDDELDDADEELKDILRGHSDEASRAEAVIRAKLATLSPTDPQVKGLTQALESITKEKMDAMRDGANIDANHSDEQATFDEVMGKEMSAQKHFAEAMRLKARLDAMVSGGLIPGGAILSAKALLDQANAAGIRGDFEAAKKLSNEAKKILEKTKDAIEDIEEAEAKEVAETPEANDTDNGIDDSDVTDLEEEIRKGEKAMDGLNR